MAEGGACLVDTHFLENGSTEYGPSNKKHLGGVGEYSAVFQKYKRRKVPAIRTFPKGCGRNAPILSELPNAPTEPKSVSELKPSLLAPIQAPNTDDLVGCGNSRKISAVRNFPFGCGRNARELTAEERRNYLASLTQKVADDYRPSLVEVRCQELVEYRPSYKEHVSRKALARSASPTKFTPRKKVTLMSKSFYHSVKLAQPVVSKILDRYEAETNDLDYVCRKEIILALMAAPNCPWMTGKSVPALNKIATSDNSCNVFDGNSDLGDDDILPISIASPEAEGGDRSLRLMPFVMNPAKHKSARFKVRETLKLFQTLVRKSQQEAARFEERNPAFRRIDYRASKTLKEKNKWVNTGKPILGHVPGVEVGDEFHYRIELCIVGLHRHGQAGIDYTEDNGTTVTTSIVATASHDDLESPEVLVYTGQGGLDPKKKPEDQKLEKGNLGLKNCIKKMTPVRVIRGFKETKNDVRGSSKAKDVSTYTYDGFYRVEKYWEERSSVHGFLVYKFLLRRLPGQPELAWKIVKQSKKSKSRPGVCVEDISKGKENLPIPVVNTVDNERPPPFEYITKIKYPIGYKHTPPRGCDCENECSDSAKCFCAFKNGGEIPFNFDGAIVFAKPLVYGCGPACKCSQSCPNRVGQHGIKIPLEVFKTESRGWGVRALTSITSGSFICEYFGEVLRDMEAEQRSNNDEYLFDIGHNYHDKSLWEGLSTLIPDLRIPASPKVVEEGLYAIDAARYGNVGRFINHSCSPNLYAQNVLYDHDDKTLPHIMFFAAENIPPLQELTYHYNYKIDQVRDSNGNIRRKYCYCGSDECSGRLY